VGSKGKQKGTPKENPPQSQHVGEAARQTCHRKTVHRCTKSRTKTEPREKGNDSQGKGGIVSAQENTRLRIKANSGCQRKLINQESLTAHLYTISVTGGDLRLTQRSRNVWGDKQLQKSPGNSERASEEASRKRGDEIIPTLGLESVSDVVSERDAERGQGNRRSIIKKGEKRGYQIGTGG